MKTMQRFFVPGSRFRASGWFVALAFIASASPATAAVTLRGIVPEDGPRTGWFERYSEARQGPEQIDKVSQTFKVGDGAALDLSHLAGDVRVTGGTGSEIRVDATKRVRHRDPEQAKRLLAALRGSPSRCRRSRARRRRSKT